MNEELKIIIKAVTSEAQKNMQAVKKELQGISQEVKNTSAKFTTAMTGIAKATAIAITAITAVITAIVALGKSTLESQKQLTQLNTAFLAAGKTVQDAAGVYKNFFRFLGESDTAVEASNLLIKLTQDEKNLAEWTKILQGVYASFPDSLPIEGLVESANETARVGQVTGNLADALNWAGESEDAFNEKLAQTTTLSEREALIRNTLNGLYGQAAEIYERNNKSLLEYNESQANLQLKTAELGATITPLLTQLNNLGAAIVGLLKPAFETILPYIAGFVMWLTEAVNRIAAFFGIVSSSSKSVETVGTKTASALDKTKKGASGVVSGLNGIKKAAEEARRSAMGFDELNIVPSNKTSASAGTGLSGSTGALDNLNLGESLGVSSMVGSLEDFQKKAEEVKNNISRWMEDWGWLLGTIGGILAALSIRNLIVQLGSAVGLGEKLAKILSFSGIASIIKSIAGWLGAVIALLKEGNGFWAVMGAAFPKIAKVVGSIGGAFAKVGGWIVSAAKAVAAFVGGLSGGAIAAIIAIVMALASAVYYLCTNWDEVVQTVKDFFAQNIQPRLEALGEAFSGLWEAVKGLVEVFVDLGKAIWDAIPEDVREWLEDVATAVVGVVKAVAQWLASVNWLKLIGSVFEWLGGLIVGTLIEGIGWAIATVIDLITGLVEILSGVINFLTGVFTLDWEKAWEGIQQIVGGIWKAIGGIFSSAFKLIKDIFEPFVNFFTGVWIGTKNIFKDVGSFFSSLFSGAWSGITRAWNGTTKFFSGVWSGIKGAFGSVTSWFSNTFKEAWQGVKNVFSTGGKIFEGIKEGIAGVFTSVVNGIIRGINKVIAVPFDTINGILNFIKDIKIAGFKPFNGLWDRNPLSVPQIPQLARGGVVDQATLALIGERGKEAVVPLENNTEWIDKLVDRLAARQDTPTKIVLNVDGRELGWANIRSINNITRQTGSLQLSLV